MDPLHVLAKEVKSPEAVKLPLARRLIAVPQADQALAMRSCAVVLELGKSPEFLATRVAVQGGLMLLAVLPGLPELVASEMRTTGQTLVGVGVYLKSSTDLKIRNSQPALSHLNCAGPPASTEFSFVVLKTVCSTVFSSVGAIEIWDLTSVPCGGYVSLDGIPSVTGGDINKEPAGHE